MMPPPPPGLARALCVAGVMLTVLSLLIFAYIQAVCPANMWLDIFSAVFLAVVTICVCQCSFTCSCRLREPAEADEEVADPKMTAPVQDEEVGDPKMTVPVQGEAEVGDTSAQAKRAN